VPISHFALVAWLLVGGCKSMTPGQLERVQPRSEEPLAGNVYLLRGFIGIWSYGIDHMGQRVADAGVRTSVYQEDQWSSLADRIIKQYKGVDDAEPLVLIGHSYGADDTLRIAKRLQENGLSIDLIITLDPVVPPKVPKNVKLCYNIYQPNLLDSIPVFRGVALETEGQDNLMNVNIRAERRDLLEDNTDHFNIEKNVKIHDEVVKKVKEVCLPRSVWLAQKQTTYSATAAKAPSGNTNAGDPAAARQAGVLRPQLDHVP
jgi:hypothetical protein